MPDYSFWQAWLLDSLHKKPKDVVIEIFNQAFLYNPRPELALDYLDYCAQLYENDDLVSSLACCVMMIDDCK
jgi:hypothetical protein